MRTKIAKTIINEYKDGKFLGLDQLRSIVKMMFELTSDKCDWNEADYQWVMTEVLYGLRED